MASGAVVRWLLAAMICIAGVRAEAAPLVVRLTLKDTVQPVSAGYLERGLRMASERQAALVLVELDTPGGLLDSTREMVAAIEKSPAPVVVYVAPGGARAGSAGFFLLEAADIAAMAPATNAGASHPIVEGRTLDPILKEKIENDAAAFLRSYTSVRGRDTAAAEDAVRQSKSYSADEALKLKLIDLIAGDDASLLAALDGRAVRRFDGASVTLGLKGAEIVDLPPSTRERFLGALTDPNLAILLLAVGGLLIYLEFHLPGTIVPGTVGTLAFLLGMFGLNLLPVRHAAVFLLVAAMVLILLEMKVASHGVLAAIGTIALVVGLATLVDAPIGEMRVRMATAVGAGVGFGAISFVLASVALRARRAKTLLGPQAMVGLVGVLMPSGQVEVRGEIWAARVVDAALDAGGSAQVVGGEGLVLVVDRVRG